MFLSGPHTPDALSLQEKRERERDGGRGWKGRPTCVEKKTLPHGPGQSEPEEPERGVELGACKKNEGG